MPSLKEELLNDISRVKEKLYPLLNKANRLNESAFLSAYNLKLAWIALETATEIIKARADDNIPASLKEAFISGKV